MACVWRGRGWFRVGGASTCGGGAKMQSKRGLHLEGAWVVQAGGDSSSGGRFKCRVGVAYVWKGRC